MITKQGYEDYLLSSGKSIKTIKNYLSSLKIICSKADAVANDIDLFSLENKEAIENTLLKIESSKNYSQLNIETHNMYSAAIRQLRDYISFDKIYDNTYLSIKISNSDSTEIVNAIQNKESNIVINQLNLLKNQIEVGQIVFMVPFGDKVEWNKGLAGIGKISKSPYGFKGKNFKIEVNMFCTFNTISRQEFIPYPGTYDAADIGPSTKGSQNQAIKKITTQQAASIIRAILELRPEAKQDILDNIDSNLLKLVFGKQEIMKREHIPYLDRAITNIGFNKIFYGIPGSGKSYHVDNVILANADKTHNVFRTTFYLDYSNTDFIGQVLPYVKGKEITYKYTPGPFTKALERALLTPDENIYLVIEEINRGNAAAIFGDIFQLLDRKNGVSEYPISNSFIENYFEQEKEKGKEIPYETGNLVIPSNLFIIGTMNTSDQNVFPLDTAFKRRWQMERITPDWDKCDFADKYIEGTEITWRNFANNVNNMMEQQSTNGITLEDKQLGPWFADESMFCDDPLANKCNVSLNRFIDKVIDYIWNDVSKFSRELWFENVFSYEKLCGEIRRYTEKSYIGEKRFLFKNITFEDIEEIQ